MALVSGNKISESTENQNVEKMKLMMMMIMGGNGRVEKARLRQEKVIL